MIGVALVGAPLVVSAQGIQIIARIGQMVSLLVPITAAVAFLVFIWGLARFIARAGDEKGREEGKKVMVWGIIALFVIVAIWGIIRFIGQELLGSYYQEGRGIPPPFIQGI